MATAFQTENVAVVHINKIEGGYLLSLSIKGVISNEAVFDNSLPCKGCDAFQVVDKLKELSGSVAPVAVATASDAAPETPQAKVNLSDPETALWEEAKKGNAEEDYRAYLSQYPKGKYIALAKIKLKRLKDEALAAAEQQDKEAWNTAQQGNNQESYAAYLETYPKGQFAALAQGRIDRVKREAAAAEAKQKREVAEAAAKGPQPGKVFKDCPDCPDMVVIPAGSFNMGSDKGGDETPAHHVTISKAFAIGKTEVTQGQWKAVMGSNPSNFANCGDDCPVEKVSWDDAKQFIQKLNSKTGKQYRLPSEAEWEYACRAGSQTEYCGGDNVDSVAWYTSNSGDATHASAQKEANAFGLYDMSGNVWEWVEDSYHDNYNGAPTDGTVWQGDGAMRVLRGGSWDFLPQSARAAYRLRFEPAYRVSGFGFRLARMLP